MSNIINLSEQNYAGAPDGYSCMVRIIAVSDGSPTHRAVFPTLIGAFPIRIHIPFLTEVTKLLYILREELQPQQEYADWMNMQKLLCMKDPDTYPMRIVGFHIILET